MQIAVRRGAISRAIFGRGECTLDLEAGSLAIVDRSSSRRFPVAVLEQPIQAVHGQPWSRIIIEASAGSFVFRGLRWQGLVEFADAANSVLRVHAGQRLAERCAGLQVASRAIEDLLGKPCFTRGSARSACVGVCNEALSMRRDRLWMMYATEQQRALYDRISRFAADSESIVGQRNEAFVERQLRDHQELFDTIESKPLTDSQRLACARDEDNNLVLAGAGTGKTSTMIGRAGYLIASGAAMPEQILMIAYARKAAAEMQERQDARLSRLVGDAPPKIKTFHALGLEIIGQAEGRRPDISPLAEDPHALAKFIDDKIELNCEDDAYKAMLVRFCGTDRFPYRNYFDFDSREQYNDYVRQNELRTLKGEVVKSFEEIEIANLLNQYGVAYKYEAAYEHDTADSNYRQYRPDFFLPDYGIYIEHFALNRAGKPPAYFAGDYAAGVEWKRALHREHKTTLIETYSYLKREDALESTLMDKLRDAGVELVMRSDAEMLQDLKKSSQVAEFAILLSDFLSLFKESGQDLPGFRTEVSRTLDGARACLLLDLLAPVLHAYEEELASKGHIDFADMIARATAHVIAARYQSPYTHIMIDEFQDISPSRAKLVRALQEQVSGCALFAVGDDWQAIYRFAGSDIAYTRDFPRIFGAAAVTALDTTFRFNSEIGVVASRFVLRNPSQSQKNVLSLRSEGSPTVSLVRATVDAQGLEAALAAIADRSRYGAAKRASVLVLSRFHFVLEEWKSSSAKRALANEFPMLDIDFMTVHAAKGKEADYVVVLGMSKGKYGFPSTKPTDPLFEYLLPTTEEYPLAEERRLFYVALTRARHRVYLVYNPIGASGFIGELIEDGYPVRTDEFDALAMCAEIPRVRCPLCGSGALVPRTGSAGAFAGCDNYPYCKHTEGLCPLCGGLMSVSGRVRRCTNPGCEVKVPICRVCGGDMLIRSGPTGRFWGCSNYQTRFTEPCRHTERLDAFED